MSLKSLFSRLTQKKELDKPSLGGETMLTRAVKMREHDAMREFLKAGADPDVKNAGGEAPLFIALGLQDREALRILLKAHATQEKQNGVTFRQQCWNAGLPDIGEEAEKIRRMRDAHIMALTMGRGFSF